MQETPQGLSPQAAARSFAWYDVWFKALASPTLETYQGLAADPAVGVGKGLLWVFIAYFISAIITLIMFSARRAALFPGLSQIGGQVPGRGIIALTLLCLAPVIGIVGFAIGTGLVQLVARLLGGHGSYEKQFYMIAAFAAPILIINSVLGLIPLLGLCLTALLGFYSIYLQVAAINAVQGFGWGKSVGTIAILIGLVIVLGACCSALGILALGPAIRDTFNQILPNLPR